MTSKNIDHRFEQLIDRISITEGKEFYIKGQVKNFTKHLYAISINTLRTKFKIYYPPLDYELNQFNYGGSFDRNTCIRQRYDVDLYLIYLKKRYGWNFININDIKGGHFFEMLRNQLDTLQYQNRIKIQVLKDFPYTHAIPIRIDYGSQVLYIDCIPAIQYRDDVLVVPNNMKNTKLVNPNSEVDALSELNSMHDGNATKLILLLKYWNIDWDKPLKSYVIERLVDHIFRECGINGWANGVKTFFNQSLHIIRERVHIPDRLSSEYSILDDYNDNVLDDFLDALSEANKYVINGKWIEVFGNF